RVAGTDAPPPYRTPVADPLPRPAEYVRAYREAAARLGSDRGAVAGTPSRAGDARSTRSAASAGGLQIILDQARHRIFRGRPLLVSGRIADGRGNGVAGLRVEVLLAADGDVPVGVTATGAGGVFQLEAAVPSEQPVGDYRLVVRTPGNREHGP